MTKKEYNDAKATVEAGNVADYNGRTAATMAELDFIRNAEGVTDDTGVMELSHEQPDTVRDASPDELSHPFTPEMITETTPAGEAAPTVEAAQVMASDQEEKAGQTADTRPRRR